MQANGHHQCLITCSYAILKEENMNKNQITIYKKLPHILGILIIFTTAFCMNCKMDTDSQAQKIKKKLDIPQESLDRFCDLIETKLKEYQVPGMAIAVVTDNDVILSEEFGWANVEEKIPVTDTTIFPIGSSTKPFTSTLIARLVTDGIMNWDDPVTQYLPYFVLKIKSDNPDDQVTIRDLLSHRTGFFHMDMIQNVVNWEQDPNWDINKDPTRYSREALLKAATEYEPKDTFRTKHNYSNISMMAAALASGQAANTNWDQLMTDKIFRPLKMKSTTTSINQIKDLQDVALGYLKSKEGNKPAELVNMDIVSPAGGINSNIIDMTQWLRFLLSEGTLKGRQLIESDEIQEMWTTQIEGAEVGGLNPAGTNYGLGWFIGEWNGYKIVEHKGNALGYSTNFALIPEIGIGYVMLSNVLPNLIQGELDMMVWEALGLRKD
jgi:CubicO group peptidase (beta-lactamase class C family)